MWEMVQMTTQASGIGVCTDPDPGQQAQLNSLCWTRLDKAPGFLEEFSASRNGGHPHVVLHASQGQMFPGKAAVYLPKEDLIICHPLYLPLFSDEAWQLTIHCSGN